LLGLNGNVMIAHGSARERAIMNAIQITAEAVLHHINRLITQKVAETSDRLQALKARRVAAVGVA
jgi:fatty acid/phospholipid biosynthesis enzyme